MTDDLAAAEDELLADLVGESPEPADDTPAETTTEADAPAGEAANAEPEPTGDEPDAPEPEVGAPDAAPAPPTSPEPTPSDAAPFAVTVYGQPHHIPGLTWDQTANAFRCADDKAFHRVQNLLTKGREWETRGRQELHQTRRQLETVSQTKGETEAQAAAYLAEWQKVLQLPEQDFLAFAQAFRQNVPRLEAQAERAAAEQVLAEAKRLQEPAEPDPESVIEDAHVGVDAVVAEMLHGQPWADPDVQRDLASLLKSDSVLRQFVFKAAADIPEQRIRRGETIADWDRLRQLVVLYAQPFQRAHTLAESKVAEATQRAALTAPVAQQNAKVLAKAGAVPAPSTRAPNGSRPSPKPIETPADIDAELDAIWQDVKPR